MIIYTTNPNSSYNIDQQVILMVETNIKQHVTQGQYNLAQGVVVIWHGTDLGNYTLEIDGTFSLGR